MEPVFPSVSFPSWTTIATGLYPESHGITGNHMYDPEAGARVFSLDLVGTEWDETADPHWWSGHVPVWASAAAEGLNVSSYLWSRFAMTGNPGLIALCSDYERSRNVI